MNKVVSISLKTVCVLLAIASVFYIQTTIYKFNDPKGFSGDHFYNPYENWDTSSVLKANFHAHTTAWGGTTNGENTPTQLIEAYKKRNYDIISISNYFNINRNNDTSALYIPVYEHGLNILKSHKLAINPSKVEYFDYPIVQSLSHKQEIINRLRDNDALVVVAHPKFLNGHTKEDLKYLEGYHFLEVLNHYRISDQHWDAALSAGKLVWIVGDDDTHQIVEGAWNTFVMWTMIHAEKSKKQALDAMKAGKMYGMRGRDAHIWNTLQSCSIINDTITFTFSNISDTLRLYGQGGELLAEKTKATSISIATTNVSNYVRCKANTNFRSIYTNPIVRYDGKNIPYNYLNQPEINYFNTWLLRVLILLFNTMFIWFCFFRKKKNIEIQN